MRAAAIGSGVLSGIVLTCCLAVPAAHATCACLCLDGAATTVCTTLDDAQQNPNACAARDPGNCPVDLDWRGGERYPPPADGAVNCREVQVWDEAESAHTSVAVCDAQPPA